MAPAPWHPRHATCACAEADGEGDPVRCFRDRGDDYRVGRWPGSQSSIPGRNRAGDAAADAGGSSRSYEAFRTVKEAVRPSAGDDGEGFGDEGRVLASGLARRSSCPPEEAPGVLNVEGWPPAGVPDPEGGETVPEDGPGRGP